MRERAVRATPRAGPSTSTRRLKSSTPSRASIVRRARGKGDKDDASTPTSSTPDPEELKLALARARTRLERSRKGLPALVEENESEGFTSDEVVEESSTAENGDLRRIVSDWFGAVGGVFDSLNSDDEAMDARDENPAIAAQDDASSSRDDDEDSSAPVEAGGWFRWKSPWQVSGVGESIATATSSWMPNKSVDGDGSFVVNTDAIGVSTASDGASSSSSDRGVEPTNLLERVPLPPWIRQRVFGSSDGDSSSDDEEDDEMAYDTTISNENVGSAIRDASETAVSVTTAAVEKLNSALLGIETVEKSAVKDGRFENNASALKALQESLRDARASAKEAREASQSLEEAVREVSRAQEALRAEGDLKKEEAIKALEAAKAAVIRQATSSNAAVADALRQVSYVATRVEKLGSWTLEDDGEASSRALDTSKAQKRGVRRGLMGAIASARESAQDALVASELTQTVSRLASLATQRGDGKSKKSEELSEMVKPALQRVVANSLVPVESDIEIGSARLACSLAAWVYYLPQMQHALPRNGLKLITSSLDVEEIIPSTEFRAGKSLLEESAWRAEQAVEEAVVAARVTASKDAKLEIAASKAAAESAELAAQALKLAAELRSQDAQDESTRLKARKTARAAKALAVEAQKKLDEASAIAERNKRKLKKWAMQRELADLQSQMQQTVIEQQRKVEAERVRQERAENASLPVNFCVAAQDDTATLWVVVEGSTNFASWQANLTFQPVTFEDPALGVEVHRGAYTAAKTMYRRIEKAVKEHVAKHGARARVRITGHSIGGSIAMIIAMMLLVRNGAPRYAIADVWAFGAPYVMTGGEALMTRLGLPRSFIRMIMMGDDVVPRSFSCYYPQWARRVLDNAPGPFNVNTSTANFLDEQMFYTPMGDLYVLQANNGSEHPLLPPGPGLYILDGDGVYEMLATRARLGENEDGEDESWLNRRPSSKHWDEAAAYDVDGDFSSSEDEKANKLRMHQLACLTQSDAALTASLIISHIKQDELLPSEGGIAEVLNQRGRDAAQRVLFNSPHPLSILSKPDAYGDAGIISRHHNPFQYAKSLSLSRKRKPGVADLISSLPKKSIDGAPASGGPR